MQIVGYILIGIGVISLFGNLSGGGGAGDPDPARATSRTGCYFVLIALGALLVWMG